VYIFRTDCDGAVTFKTDGHHLRTETFFQKTADIPEKQQIR
jgi:beta-lactamase superfamily II metal-dependent hydrolase